ncbi:hypothetical protein M885DRAFT_521244 [Pelagophyceae sp. CCMP2097]|nr:hypothetical protein M885DRAFT_521244 [Pelagophyceae sp. CCMP2097]
MPTLAKVLRELKVEDALLYLDQVKMEFGDKPEIYNEFLDIMKNFKAQEIDTPGVIEQVSQLFRGYNKLILGFNMFLPDGYKIELSLDDGEDAMMTVHMPPGVSVAIMGANVSSGPMPRDRDDEPAQMDTSNEEPPPDAPVEFDHAITYVTTIKKRFAHEPETYKAFLEILHTYQKEQRSIKDVLEQVSQLFADHADLLKEFTYFLPDAVQEQAKERLSRAARESDMRRARAQQQQQGREPHFHNQHTERARSGPARGQKGGNASSPRHSSMTASIQLLSGQNRAAERHYFERVKEALTSGASARDGWPEFLKCLDLYSQDLLQRSEMLQFVAELVGKAHPELLDEFKRVLHARGAAEQIAPQHDMRASPAMAEVDFSQCSRCTPSYRALPDEHPSAACSECAADCKAVLNDRWVSQPVGSEESYSFKHMRKNQFEEALFRCEDERFEIDMVIDSNSSAIRAFEPLAEELAALKARATTGDSAAPAFRVALERKALSTVYLNAVARIYGEHAGEVLDLLKKTPEHTIPVVLKRLKQKDSEWRSARHEMSKHWNELLQRNSERARDHRSFYFRQAEKRTTAPRHLLLELKAMREAALRTTCTDEAADAEDAEVAESAPKATSPEMVVKVARPALHSSAFHAVAYAAEQSAMPQADKSRVVLLWRSLRAHLVGLPDAAATPAADDAPAAALAAALSAAPAASALDDLSAAELQPTPPPPAGAAEAAPATFVGTSHAYVALRLYALVVERFGVAAALCEARGDVGAAAGTAASGFEAFLCMVHGLVDASYEAARFEDGCRALIGNEVYLFCTLDKVVAQLLKQLQLMVNDRAFCKLHALWLARIGLDAPGAALRRAADGDAAEAAPADAAATAAPSEAAAPAGDAPDAALAPGAPASLRTAYRAHARHVLQCLDRTEDLYIIGYRPEAGEFVFEYLPDDDDAGHDDDEDDDGAAAAAAAAAEADEPLGRADAAAGAPPPEAKVVQGKSYAAAAAHGAATDDAGAPQASPPGAQAAKRARDDDDDAHGDDAHKRPRDDESPAGDDDDAEDDDDAPDAASRAGDDDGAQMSTDAAAEPDDGDDAHDADAPELGAAPTA